MLIEEARHLDNEDSLLWLCENKDLLEKFKDYMILESIKIDQFERMYGFLLDDLAVNYRSSRTLSEEYHRENKQLLTELEWSTIADIGIGVGSLLPGIGSGVAVGGTLYYLYRAYDNTAKGLQFESYMDLFAAIMTAGQVVPIIGAATGAVGKAMVATLKAVFGPIFKLLKIVGGKIAPLLGKKAAELTAKESGTLTKAAGEVSAEAGKHMDDLAKTAGPLKKVAGYLESFLDFLISKKTTLEPVAKKMGFSVDKGIKLLESFKGKIGNFTKVAAAAEKGSVAEVVESATKIGVETGEISAKSGDDILRLQKLEAKLASTERVAARTTKGEQIAQSRLKIYRKVGGDDAAKYLTRSRNLVKRNFQKMVDEVPGLQDEFLTFLKTQKGVPKNATLEIAETGIRIKTPTTKRLLKYSAGSSDDVLRGYTQLGKFLKDSKVYKTYTTKLTSEIDNIASEMAKVAAKEGDTATVTAIKGATEAIEETVEAAVASPEVSKGLGDKIMIYFFNPGKEKIFQGIVRSILGFTAAQTSRSGEADIEAEIDRLESEGY